MALPNNPPLIELKIDGEEVSTRFVMPPSPPAEDTASILAQRAADLAAQQREDLIAVWLTRHNMTPEDVMQVQQMGPDGEMRWWLTRKVSSLDPGV